MVEVRVENYGSVPPMLSSTHLNSTMNGTTMATARKAAALNPWLARPDTCTRGGDGGGEENSGSEWGGEDDHSWPGIGGHCQTSISNCPRKFCITI